MLVGSFMYHVFQWFKEVRISLEVTFVKAELSARLVVVDLLASSSIHMVQKRSEICFVKVIF